MCDRDHSGVVIADSRSKRNDRILQQQAVTAQTQFILDISGRLNEGKAL